MPNTTRGSKLNGQAEAVTKARRAAGTSIQKCEDVLLAQEERHARRAANGASSLTGSYPALGEGGRV